MIVCGYSDVCCPSFNSSIGTFAQFRSFLHAMGEFVAYIVTGGFCGFRFGGDPLADVVSDFVQASTDLIDLVVHIVVLHCD